MPNFNKIIFKGNENLKNQLNFNFVSNNVKGLQSSKKRLKLINFLKNKIGPKGILFLQETHSSVEKEKKWIDDFKDKIYYSHGKTNSCGVLIAIYSNLNIRLKNKIHDNDGRVLILDATINGSDYLLINFYNANTEREQLTAIKNLNNLLKDFEDFHDKKVIFAGDFNLIFDRKLESAGGNPLLKKHSLSEIIKLNENLNLCDIWRVRNPHKKLFTFRQKHFTGIIHRRLDCIFVSNVLQEPVKKTEILNALSSDHSPVFCSFVNNDIFARGSGVWKSNNSLLLNTEFVKKLKTHIKTVKSNLQENSSFSDHSKWEFLKYEIRKFSIFFSKYLAKKERIIQINLENRIKTLDQSLKNEEDFYAYNLCKLELENIYDKKTEGAKLRSKCEWYQHGEKLKNFFLNLEKQKAIDTTVRHLIDDGKDITDLKEINACICKFYKNLFKKNVSKSDSENKSFLDSIALPNLTSKSFDICEVKLQKKT